MNSGSYGNQVYWEQHYKKTPGERFDWLLSFESLKPILTSYIPSVSSTILYVGCGTSELADKLCDLGYTNITCIDFSKEAIKQQTEYSKKKEKQGKSVPNFQFMDVMHMDFEPGNFDVVIDKCTVDSILSGEDYLRKCLKTLREISRVLKEDGVYLMFSHESPSKRIYYLKNRLTKFSRVEYFPVNRFETVKLQSNKHLNQSKDDAKSMMSRVSSIEKSKRNHYCYVCIRQEGAEIQRNRQNIKEESLEDEKSKVSGVLQQEQGDNAGEEEGNEKQGDSLKQVKADDNSEQGKEGQGSDIENQQGNQQQVAKQPEENNQDEGQGENAGQADAHSQQADQNNDS